VHVVICPSLFIPKIGSWVGSRFSLKQGVLVLFHRSACFTASYELFWSQKSLIYGGPPKCF
jgi:hypothetical protein